MSYRTDNPFLGLSQQFMSEPIERFDPQTKRAKTYLDEVCGDASLISSLFIGWVCEPNTFFAYLHMGMKKQAREAHSTQMAAQMAQAGFPILLPQINDWVKTRRQPVLFVPIASRYGVSERFAEELSKMLEPSNRVRVSIKNLFQKLDKSVEVKSIYSWPGRNLAVQDLFELTARPDLTNYSILLVDDFVSSGSSLRQAAAMLKTLGPTDVAAVALSTNLFIYKQDDR